MNRNLLIIVILLLISMIGYYSLSKMKLLSITKPITIPFDTPQPATKPIPAPTPTSSPREDDYMYNCTQDSDCVSVGCACNQPQAAVNKKYVNEWNQKYFTPPKNCLAVMCFYTNKCINNKCQLGKKGKS